MLNCRGAATLNCRGAATLNCRGAATLNCRGRRARWPEGILSSSGDPCRAWVSCAARFAAGLSPATGHAVHGRSGRPGSSSVTSCGTSRRRFRRGVPV